jgi:ABC-type transporter Mla subunit MlaD
MADFNESVAAQVPLLGEFTRRLGQVEEGWQRMQQSVQQGELRVREETQAMLGKIAALATTVRQARETVQGDVDALGQLLDEVDTQLDTHRQTVTQTPQEVRTGMSTLEGEVDQLTPAIDEAIGKAEAAMQTCVERAGAIDGTIEDVTTHVEQVLHEQVPATAEQQQTEVGQAVTSLQQLINDTTVPALAEEVTRFQGHLDQVVAKLEAKLAEGGERTASQTQEVIENVVQQQGEQVRVLIERVHTLTETVHNVGSLLQTGADSVVRTTDLLVDGARSTNAGVEVVLGLLRETEELLQRVRI